MFAYQCAVRANISKRCLEACVFQINKQALLITKL